MRFALLIFLALTLATFGAGLVAPVHTVVAREAQLQAAPADVIGLVSDLERWVEWSPMFGGPGGATPELSFGERRSGPGAQVQLDFDGRLCALLTIVDSDPAEGVWIETRSGSPDLDLWGGEGFRAADSIVVEADGSGSRVTWTRRGDEVKFPLLRLLDYALTRPRVGRQIEGELAGLAAAFDS